MERPRSTRATAADKPDNCPGGDDDACGRGHTLIFLPDHITNLHHRHATMVVVDSVSAAPETLPEGGPTGWNNLPVEMMHQVS